MTSPVASMRERAEEYLTMRRALGYRLFCQGRLLLDFADNMDRTGQTRLTTQAALAWATQSPDIMVVTGRIRLSVVRCFARHLATLDPTCEVPPTGLLRAPARRPTPYLYTPQEISALIHAAGTLPNPLPAATYQALISLLAATGMRIGEALSLDRSNADLETGILHADGTASGWPAPWKLAKDHPDSVRPAFEAAYAHTVVLVALPTGPWPLVALHVQPTDDPAVAVHPSLLDLVGWSNLGQVAKIFSILTNNAQREALELLTPSQLRTLGHLPAGRPRRRSIFDLTPTTAIEDLARAALTGTAMPLAGDEDHLLLCSKEWTASSRDEDHKRQEKGNTARSE